MHVCDSTDGGVSLRLVLYMRDVGQRARPEDHFEYLMDHLPAGS